MPRRLILSRLRRFCPLKLVAWQRPLSDRKKARFLIDHQIPTIRYKFSENWSGGSWDNVRKIVISKKETKGCTSFTNWKEMNGNRSKSLDILRLLLDCITVLRTYMRPIVTDRVAWSVCLSVDLSHYWALQKRLKQSRCRLRWGLGWAQGTTYAY